MYFISIGRPYLIPLHILTLEGPVEIVWESMGGSSQDKNNWLLSNSCGRQDNEGKQLRGVFEIAFLQIRQPRIQKKKKKREKW